MSPSRMVAIVLLVLGASASAALAAPVEPLGHAGRWITDARGRVVVLHGFNVVPADESVLPRDMGMGRDNARWLARHGFNTVRLGFYYARVEPRLGRFDDAYLDDYLRVQRELANEGIFTLLGAHQDQLNARYGVGGALHSRGFPDWFLKDDGLPNPRTPYPNGYLSNPALNRGYDNIFRDFRLADGRTVQQHLRRGWRRIAARFRGRPGMLGYDVFNEPWPGSSWSSCLAGCPAGGFDQTLLTAFTRKLVGALRGADPRHLIFYEPNLLFDFGIPTGVGDPGDAEAGFSFHDYCAGNPLGYCPDESDQARVFDNAEAQTHRTGDALLLTEFGFEPAAAVRGAELADRAMVSWQRWDYYGDHAAATLDRGRLDALVRPYPQVVAGTPRHWSFDAGAGTFELVYSTKRVTGEGAELTGHAAGVAPGRRFPAGARTEIFVPKRHFPHGYRVEVSGARVISRRAARLLVLASRHDARRVQVRVSATRGRGSGRGR